MFCIAIVLLAEIIRLIDLMDIYDQLVNILQCTRMYEMITVNSYLPLDEHIEVICRIIVLTHLVDYHIHHYQVGLTF
jgi:hypothetical protein